MDSVDDVLIQSEAEPTRSSWDDGAGQVSTSVWSGGAQCLRAGGAVMVDDDGRMMGSREGRDAGELCLPLGVTSNRSAGTVWQESQDGCRGARACGWMLPAVDGVKGGWRWWLRASTVWKRDEGRVESGVGGGDGDRNCECKKLTSRCGGQIYR